MQHNDFSSIELPASCLSNLDAALNRLGMLATGAESRRQYLKEIRNTKTNITSCNSSSSSSNSSNNKLLQNMIKINTNYVSTVSIGLRQIAPHTVRYKPYTIKERLRTRSENNDDDIDNQNLLQQQQQQLQQHHQQCMDDDGLINIKNDDLTQLKKAKSLESIIAESTQPNQIDLKNIRINCNEILATTTTPTDMEVVSNSIQNLKVDE